MTIKQRIIDIHAHIFPEKVAGRAVEAIGEFYTLDMEAGSYGGTCEALLASGTPCGVGHYVVHSVATRPDQAVSINNFIAASQEKYPQFIGFGTLHPFMENAGDEVGRIIALGLQGVKLHPDFQSFNIDDERAIEMYKLFAGRLPVLMHMGDETRDYSAPRRLAHAMEKVPGLVVIAAHLGGYQRWDEAMEYVIGSPAYIDTSSALKFMSPERARTIIEAHGVQRVLWGSDYPMWLHGDELARYMNLGFDEEVNERILYANSAALLGL